MDIPTMLADLSDESPELFAQLINQQGVPHIEICVAHSSMRARAVLPIDELDLYAVSTGDAVLSYEHLDGPLPSTASPAALEFRAQGLRRLEDQIETAYNRLAVAEERGYLEPWTA